MQHLDKLGYYEVNGKKYLHKMEAFVQAKSWNKVNYIFNDQYFEKYDWTKEPQPNLSLQDFYRIRAQQIRNEFDYVVLMYSGGPDSQNMVETFVDNQIPFDEMVCINSYDRTKMHYGTIHNADWIHNSKPSLDRWIKDFNLKSRVTVIDEIELTKNYFKVLENQGDWQFVYNTAAFASQDIFKLNWVKNVDHLWRIILSGKKVGIIFGTEKPTITVDKTNRYYTRWFDLGLTDSHFFMSEDSNLKASEIKVLFYSSVDSMDLIAKQLHSLKNFMDKYRGDEFYDILPKDKKHRPPHICINKHNGKNLKYNIYHKIIYPKWNPSIITPKGFAMIDKRVQDNWWLNQLDPKETAFYKNSWNKFAKFGFLPMIFSKPLYIE